MVFKGDDIPLVGRIACVADVFDALTTWIASTARRLPVEEAIAMVLRRARGAQFDPVVVDAFMARTQHGMAAEPELRP